MQKLKKLLAVQKLKRVNLKWITQASMILLLGGFFLYLNSSPPFMAIASNSMEPALSRGDLIFSAGISPNEVAVGDVIIYKVPEAFQEKYGYPPTVCHRVIRIQTSGEKLSFRTKGDNTGEDPFMVLPEQVIGREVQSIPYLGYVVMFPQSRQGWFFLGGLVILILLYSNSDYLLKNGKKVRQSLVGISSSDLAQSQGELERKMGLMSDQVAQSMNGFSTAMSEYAKHIASHTSAIQSLAQAAKHMESIMAKQEAAIQPFARTVEPVPPVSEKPSIFTGIEVTPELKAAVKEFIQDYCVKHGITSVVVTPELRTAVWEFIQDYVKMPHPKLELKASTADEMKPESATEESVDSGQDKTRIQAG